MSRRFFKTRRFLLGMFYLLLLAGVTFAYLGRTRPQGIVRHSPAPPVVTPKVVGGTSVSNSSLQSGQPVITSFLPASGTIGSRITVFGQGFGRTVEENTVSVNGIQAEIVAVSGDQMVFIAPTSTDGPIQISTPSGSTTSGQSFSYLPRVVMQPRGEGIRITPGGTIQFSATVNNAPAGTQVEWSVNGVVGGNASLGIISPTGLYTAPSVVTSACQQGRLVIRATLANQMGATDASYVQIFEFLS